jgi:uncharacterized damage-inducible protein DinB
VEKGYDHPALCPTGTNQGDKTMRSTSTAIRLLLTLVILAGAPLTAAHHEGAPDGFMADVIKNIQDTEKKLVSLAEAVPADKFSWAPSEDVRPFSAVYVHLAATNFFLPPALGATPAEGVEAGESVFATMQKMEAEITDKEAVIAKLKESYQYVYKALPTIEDLDTVVELFGPPSSKRHFVLIILSHGHEHLGQSIAYARSIGVVPPWSQRQEEEGEGEGDEGGR